MPLSAQESYRNGLIPVRSKENRSKIRDYQRDFVILHCDLGNPFTRHLKKRRYVFFLYAKSVGNLKHI